eukprot:g69125.t1
MDIEADVCCSGPWCICMWAFARMLQAHPPYDSLLICDATHEQVLLQVNPEKPTEQNALQAVCERCRVLERADRPDLLAACRVTPSAASTGGVWLGEHVELR